MGIIGSFEGYVSSPLYLFNNGVWSNLQTPGISLVYNGTSFDIVDCKKTDSGYIGISGYRGQSKSNTSGSAFSRLNQSLNLSPYNAINVTAMNYGTMDGSATFYFGVSTNANLTSHSYAASISRFIGVTESTTETKSINISSLSGNYYIYFSFSFTKQFSAAVVSTSCSQWAREVFLTY